MSDAGGVSERVVVRALEHSPDIVVCYDAFLRRVYANRKYEQVTGLKPSQYLGRSLEADAARSDGVLACLRRALATGDPQELDYELRAASGAVLWFNLQVAVERDASGAVAGLVTFARDITERKRNEVLLRLQAETELRLRRLTEMAPGAFYTCLQTRDGRLRHPYVSPRYTELTGLKPQEVAEDLSAVLALIHPEDVPHHVKTIAMAYRNQSPWRNEFRLRHPSRGELWLEAKATPERQADGSTVWYGFMHDISARKRMEAAWHFVTERGWGLDGEAFLPALAHYLVGALGVDFALVGRLADGVATVETVAFHAGNEILPNLCYPLAGTPSGSLADRSVCCYPQRVRECFPADRMLVELGVESYAGIPLLDVDGTPLGLIAVMSRQPFADPQSTADVLRLVATRASAELIRERSDRLLLAREREFRTIVEQSPDSIVRYDRHGERVYANPRARRMERAGQPLDALPLQGERPAEAEGYRRMIAEVLATGTPRSAELTVASSEGGATWLDMRVCPELDDDGHVESVFAIGRDITESVALREKIREQSLTDPLTRLANRQALYERGPGLLAAAARYGRKLGVMLLDVDRFKQVNDTLGHSAGDQLLREVSRRISGCIREHDLLVRMGGDEFVVIATNVEMDVDVAILAARVGNALAAPSTVAGRPAYVSASIGIAVYPDDGADLESLLAHADGAMYQAKHSGRNRFEFHRPEFSARAQRRLALEAALREAQNGAGLELYFQPKIRLDDGALVGAEALLRWQHPELGLVTPDHFVPIAEETGLIVPIGRWVFRHAVETVVRWNRGRPTPLKLAVNVSTRQFMHDDLLVMVRDTLRITACDPRWVEIEVTESVLLDDDDRARQTLRALAGLGVTIAIDDFGTGYSALGYLAKFDVHCLKIDRQFVSGIEHDARQGELLKAFVAIAGALGLELVAEGVESAAQSRFLAEHGCPLAQGNLFDAAMPAAAFEQAWLSSRSVPLGR